MLYLSAIILAFFLSFVLVTKRNKSQADIILLAWLFVTGFHLLTFYLFFTGRQFEYPSIVALGFPLPLAQGPFLYLYTRQQTSVTTFDKKQLLHFLPVILSYLLFIPFYLLPFEQRAEVFVRKGEGFTTELLINRYAIYLSGIVYVGLSLARLVRYRKSMVQQFSNTERINFNWLLYLIIWMLIIWTVVLFAGTDQLIFGAAALFVLWLGYFGIKQVQVFHQYPKQPAFVDTPILVSSEQESQPDNEQNQLSTDPVIVGDINQEKYQKSSLSQHDASLIHERLNILMAEEKPFTSPDLTLTDLAKRLSVHPNYLSQVINSKENKSFYDLVNEKRVEEFIRLITEPSRQQYTLVSIAYDCGFNSKASFNRNFKKYTGVTPTEYVKSLPQQVA